MSKNSKTNSFLKRRNSEKKYDIQHVSVLMIKRMGLH